MIRRFRNWLKSLSLTQQLLYIIFTVVLILSFCEVSIYTDTLNIFVQNQMYQTLDQIQPSIVSAYQYADKDLYTRVMENTPETCSLLLNNGKIFTLETSSFFDEGMIPSIMEAISADEHENHISFKYEKKQYYGAVTVLKGNNVLITILDHNYVKSFRSAVLDNILNYNLLIVVILFFFLLVWVSSIIHPLNLINTYIKKIQNGEDAELKINRKDEIGQVADSLLAMSKELAEQNRVKEEMIQNISHDLKTPIATIKSYGESIKDGIYPYDSLEKSVDVIIENADRLEKKVVSLLVLNKMGYLSDTLEPGNNLDMVQVIEKAILSLKVIRPELQMTTDLEYEFFHGEEEPWRIVIENILDNAIRYAKSEIIIELKKDSLAIYNDGPQMSAERLAKMFKPYEKGTDGKFGLGMSIVYRVCVTYGYKVSAENTENGVVFRIVKVH